MMKLFKVILFILVFCTAPWLLANDKQKQDLRKRFETLIALGEQLLPIDNERQKKPEKTTEVLPDIDGSIREDSEQVSGSGEKYQVNSCSKVMSSKVNHKIEVYEWTDDKGRRQLSDIPPLGSYTNLKVKGLYVENYFNLKLDSRYADLPAFTQSHIQSGVAKIYKTLVQVIKVSELRAIELNLKFFSNKEQFHKYRQKVAPDTGFKTTGFYTSRLNEATIFAVGSKEHMTSITLHESTHAIVAAMFGGAPVWLNEGLASFFDQMINSNRRDFLRGMLEHLAVNDCHEFSTVSYINQHYPGGLSRLESGWLSWLRNAPSGTITF